MRSTASIVRGPLRSSSFSPPCIPMTSRRSQGLSTRPSPHASHSTSNIASSPRKASVGLHVRPHPGGYGRVPLRISGISLDVTQRKQAEENLRFLSRVGQRAFGAVDLESTMQKFLRLAVPVLADWCVVNIFGQFGEAEYVAQAHRHRDKEPALKRLVDYAARVRDAQRRPRSRRTARPSSRARSRRAHRRGRSRRQSPVAGRVEPRFLHRRAAIGARAGDRVHLRSPPPSRAATIQPPTSRWPPSWPIVRPWRSTMPGFTRS